MRERAARAMGIGAGGALVLALAACSNHDCDSTTVDAGPGTVLAEGATLLWESAPLEGPWLDYPGGVSASFSFPEGFRCPVTLTAYLSTAPYQGQDAGTFILASGYLATFTNTTPAGFTVTNGACAEYFLRVTATASASGCATPDGGAGAQ